MAVPAETRARIGEAIEEQLAAGCPGVILEIDAPRLGVVMREARGVFARGEARPLLVGDGFRAASVTKAATAAVAVGLAARGRWRLDDSVATYLPADLIEKLSRLDGLEDSGELTIRRLLAHSSGVPDYFFDPGFQSRVERDPDRRWRPQELFAAAMSVGRLLFPPGSDFAYGDSAYVMVGLAIEQLLGVRLSDAFRSVVFEPLAMEATYLEFHETPRGCELSHHYRGDEDLHGRNLSFDWSGGGLVTTAADLSAFLRGLFGGVLFERRWLDEMTAWQTRTRWRAHGSARYLRYGLGIGTNVAFGEEIIGVTGVWGAFAYYWPAADATVTGTLNLVGADRPALMDAVVAALHPLRGAAR